MLEALGHEGNSSFVTLTYAEDKVPFSMRGRPTLEIAHLRAAIKRMRKSFGATRIRYFACGEYGDLSERPHYHLALFGPPPCFRGPYISEGKGVICLCKTCSVVRHSWGFGHIMVAELSAKSAMYIAGYVVKKMTHSLDPRLSGRAPEFARMSLRPGLGALALAPVVSVLEKYRLPVPAGIRHGKKILPLGRYLRRQIALMLTDGSVEEMDRVLNKKAVLSKNLEAVRVLRNYSWANEERPLDVLKQITPNFTPSINKGRSL